MLLADLLKYDRIVVQMHDNPDADAVGSGFAVYKYLKEKGKNAELVYAGKNKITKSNILLLLEELEIPVSYLGEAEQTVELEDDALLLTVDCQYGEGNVEKINAKNIAMIDHHNTGRLSDEHCEIRSHLVSCSTIVYDMLLNENYNI
ncbi:MAG: DHH family phosphoesterase, partial [Lachnospiraceae bacterium]|nr:DHH family phosphoesterase [Lachnospiraceae bacterium]